MNDPTTTGWVTFQKIRVPGGRTLLVQKRDGCTRTIVATSGAHR